MYGRVAVVTGPELVWVYIRGTSRSGVNNNMYSPIQDYVHPDDQTQPTFDKGRMLQILRQYDSPEKLKDAIGFLYSPMM